MGDKLLLKLNIYGKPIANKYCEGKMKRTLKRGLKDLKSLSRKLMKDNHLYAIFACIGRSPCEKVRKAYYTVDNGRLSIFRMQEAE